MAEDFRAKITAELDTAEAENKLEAFLNKKNKLKIDVEVNQDSAKKLGSSIERGIRQTKFDTSSITEQLAGSFNISDKNVLSRMKKQMDTMVSSLGKTWNGSDFDFKNASGFYSGLNNLSDTVTKNAKIVQGKTGIYDDFFNYFKDKKIYVSDNKLIAMFDNWDKVQSLTETALNADGTAQKKFEDNYLTSLEAKTNALKASLENLATSTVSSDLYSGFLDGSKSLVDFANNINLVQSAIAGLVGYINGESTYSGGCWGNGCRICV